ncbi:RidA family protein [Streptomyces sp. NPDC007162]|uniref:RidA family protein n=1 Tax=Streptomyces sp. NPDC007162 TaxID=3156917 RepID=UPI0033FB0252
MIRRVTAPGLFPPPGDPVRQAERVIVNLAGQLRAVGSDLVHVVATDVYVVSSDPTVLSAVWEVVEGSGLSAGPHSSTLVGVACLGYSGQLVEITATAVVPEGAGA